MKKLIGPKTLAYPLPVFIIGSYGADRKPNMMAASWGGICSSVPPSIAVSIRHARKTYENIMLNKAFTVNIPSAKYARECDYVGIFSGRDEDKFVATGLTPLHSEIVNAPMIKEFPLSLICKLAQTVDVGSHVMFIGEILDVAADPEVLNAKELPDFEKVDTLIYDYTGKKYYGVGKEVSQAYLKHK